MADTLKPKLNLRSGASFSSADRSTSPGTKLMLSHGKPNFTIQRAGKVQEDSNSNSNSNSNLNNSNNNSSYSMGDIDNTPTNGAHQFVLKSTKFNGVLKPAREQLHHPQHQNQHHQLETSTNEATKIVLRRTKIPEPLQKPVEDFEPEFIKAQRRIQERLAKENILDFDKRKSGYFTHVMMSPTSPPQSKTSFGETMESPVPVPNLEFAASTSVIEPEAPAILTTADNEMKQSDDLNGHCNGDDRKEEGEKGEEKGEEKPVEKLEEKAVVKAEETAEEKVEEKLVMKVVEKAEENPVEVAVEKVDEKAVVKAEAKLVMKLVEKAEENPVEKAVEKVEEKSEEKPVDKAEEKSEEKPMDKAEDWSEEKSEKKAEWNEDEQVEEKKAIEGAVVAAAKSNVDVPSEDAISMENIAKTHTVPSTPEHTTETIFAISPLEHVQTQKVPEATTDVESIASSVKEMQLNGHHNREEINTEKVSATVSQSNGHAQPELPTPDPSGAKGVNFEPTTVVSFSQELSSEPNKYPDTVKIVKEVESPVSPVDAELQDLAKLKFDIQTDDNKDVKVTPVLRVE